MPLTKQEFEDINNIYGGQYRRLDNGATQSGVAIQTFKINVINLNYAFDPRTSKGWLNDDIVFYESNRHERLHNITFSPEPDSTIDPTKWFDLIQQEGQLLEDMWDAEKAKPKDWGYGSETVEFQLKKAMLAIDVFKRYHAWGDRMYDMFKSTNPKHAEFFLQAIYESNTARMLSWAHSDLFKVDLKKLSPEQRGLWIKLMLYTIDKNIALLRIYNPEREASQIRFNEFDYQKIRESGFQELIDMIPPEEKQENVEQGYLGMAMSYVSSVASTGLGFLPGFRAQQNAAPSENEKLVTAKIESLNKELDEKLTKISDHMPVKSANTIIDKINEMLDYISENKIDVTNNSTVNNFTATNFTKALNYFNKIPVDARKEVLERAQMACDSFKECYAKNAALLKVTTDHEVLKRVDELYNVLTSKVGSTPQQRKKLG